MSLTLHHKLLFLRTFIMSRSMTVRQRAHHRTLTLILNSAIISLFHLHLSFSCHMSKCPQHAEAIAPTCSQRWRQLKSAELWIRSTGNRGIKYTRLWIYNAALSPDVAWLSTISVWLQEGVKAFPHRRHVDASQREIKFNSAASLRGGQSSTFNHKAVPLYWISARCDKRSRADI